MMARTHIAFGLLTAAILHPYLGGDPFIFYLLILLGVLLPDIYHQSSSINKLMPITNILPHIFAHRGIFHSVFPAAGLMLLFSIFSRQEYGIYLAMGYLAHLASDALTKMGVNLLYPVVKIKIRGPVTTGTHQETVVCAIVMAVTIGVWVVV